MTHPDSTGNSNSRSADLGAKAVGQRAGDRGEEGLHEPGHQPGGARPEWQQAAIPTGTGIQAALRTPGKLSNFATVCLI